MYKYVLAAYVFMLNVSKSSTETVEMKLTAQILPASTSALYGLMLRAVATGATADSTVND